MKILLILLTVLFNYSFIFCATSSSGSSSISSCATLPTPITAYEKKVRVEYDKLSKEKKQFYEKYIEKCIKHVDPTYSHLRKISGLTQNVFEYFCLSPELWKKEFDKNNNKLINEILLASKKESEADALKNINELFEEDIKPNPNTLWHEEAIPILLLALLKSLPQITKLLILKGADIQVQNFGRLHFTELNSPLLIIAASKNYIDIVQLLLDKGIDINIRDRFEKTALMHASSENHINIVKLLLERGADFNENDLKNLTENYVQYLDPQTGWEIIKHRANEETLKILKEYLESKIKNFTSSSSSTTSNP